MNFLKFYFPLAIVFAVGSACSSDDDGVTTKIEETIISEVSFSTSVNNSKGNEISVLPTSTGGESYVVDFGDSSNTENSDVITSDGSVVSYLYPETDATYTIKVIASAADATDVSLEKEIVVDYKEDVVVEVITNVNFTTSSNSEGNKISLTPTSTGGTSYVIDFGDTSVTDDSDVLTSDGSSVSYTYPEADATYTVKITASAVDKSDVSIEETLTIDYNVVVIGGPFAINKTIDFESDGYGANWAWNVFENDDNPAVEFVNNPDPSGINTSSSVAKIIARQAGAPWVGAENVHGEMGITWDLNSSNAVIKIMVYKTVISDVGIKLANPAGGAQIEIKVANTKINEWEELSFDFSSRIGNGLDGSTNIDQIIVFPDFTDGRKTETVTYFDNITFRSN